MKIIDQAKQFLGSTPLVAEFVINKKFTLKEGKLAGKLQLLPKSEVTVTHVHYKLEELFEQTHNNNTDNNKYLLGEKDQDFQAEVSPLDTKTIDFELEYDIEKGSYGDKRVYSGDMAVMNKLSDRAKKRSSTYQLSAEITIQEQEKPITTSTIVKFK